MNVIETRYRLQIVVEDLNHEDSKLAVIEVEARLSDADRDRLRSASWHILRAQQQIREVSLGNKQEDLCKILEVSIDDVRARRSNHGNGAGTEKEGH